MDTVELLTPTAILLSAGFFVILCCRLMRISPIIGFLVAGLVLGPFGLDIIEENKITAILAKLGVVFLLFDIGLHFSMQSAWKLRKDLFGLAPLQMLLTGVLIAFTLNFIFDIPADFALLAGFALALSSTAVVMQVIADLKQTESPVGQSAKSILIFQDIIAVFLLIFADAAGGDTVLITAVGSALVKTILALFITIWVGRYLLTPLMRMITKYDDPEMFTVLGLVIVMLTALATDSAGLSLTLGAFLAGMVLAETPFRILLQNELRPFRSLLIAFFFMTIGMSINIPSIAQNLDIVLGILVLIMALKALIIASLTYGFGRPTHHVLQLSSMLAQGSEFALIVFTMASVAAGLGNDITQNLIAAVALSMLVTPIISAIGYRWSLKVCDNLQGITNCPNGSDNPVIRDPVFIVGMNEVGKTLARAFKAHNIPYIAIDSRRKRFIEATAAGYIVIFGQPSDLRFWNTLGVSEAKAMCIATPRYEVTRDLAPIVSKLYPNLKRYAAVGDSAEGVRFASLGLQPFHNGGAPPGLEMAGHVLKELGIDENIVLKWSEEEQNTWLAAHPSADLEALKEKEKEQQKLKEQEEREAAEKNNKEEAA